MYQGFVGPPAFLHSIWPGSVDGEMSYDVTFAEMFLVLLIVGWLVIALLDRLRSQTNG